METTNFFRQIAQLNITGVLQLDIAKGAENSLVVSVLLNNEQCGDKAKHLIPPLTFNATPQQLDDSFFQRLTTPMEKVSDLMMDMEKFLKQVEQAKNQSAMEKEEIERQRKQQEAKDKKFKDGMAKVDELEKAGKFREAWVKVPDEAEFPEKAEEIRKRKSSLSPKFDPDLFNSTPMDNDQPEEADYPSYASNEIEEEMQFDQDQDNDIDY